MKRVVFAFVVLAVILVAGVLETVFVHKLFTALDQKLENLEVMVQDESEFALSEAENLTTWWEQKRYVLEIVSYSPDIRAFSVALGETVGSLKCGDFQNSLSKCRSLIVMSKNIHQILDFNFEDIF